MLKHIVTLSARNPHEVTVIHKVTDGIKTAYAKIIVTAYMGAYSVRVGKHHPYEAYPQFIVRITDMRHHEHILEDVRKQAMAKFHADIHTEFRMNEY